MAEAGFPWQATHDSMNADGHEAISSEKREAGPEGTTSTRSGSISRSDQKKPGKYQSLGKHGIAFSQPSTIPKPQVRFDSSQSNQLQGSTQSKPRIPVRTIPPWIQDATEDDVIEASQYLPDNPEIALIAKHVYEAHGEQDGRGDGGYPMSSGRERDAPTSRWISFARASAYPRENFHSEKVDPEWLDRNFTDYSKPWCAGHTDDDFEEGIEKQRLSRRKRRAWYTRAHRTVMRNPFIPLGFRLMIITFATIAIGIAASIWHENRVINGCIHQQQGHRSAGCAAKIGQGYVLYTSDPSALMTLIVDSVSIVYSFYITYDEYFSKPLGLRSPAAKVRLVLLDLFFIVFQTATISLVFNSLHVLSGPCHLGLDGASQKFDRVCHRAQALSAMLVLSLLAWLQTFSVSILRLVERMSTR